MMRMWMLAEIINKQNDIILLQEVTRNDFDLIKGYNACTNVGINENGTTIITRETTKLTKITRVGNGSIYICIGFCTLVQSCASSEDSELCRVPSGWITSPSLSEFGGS
jgi:hypothetical protein